MIFQYGFLKKMLTRKDYEKNPANSFSIKAITRKLSSAFMVALLMF